MISSSRYSLFGVGVRVASYNNFTLFSPELLSLAVDIYGALDSAHYFSVKFYGIGAGHVVKSSSDMVRQNLNLVYYGFAALVNSVMTAGLFR